MEAVVVETSGTAWSKRTQRSWERKGTTLIRGQQGKRERGGTQHGDVELGGGAALGVDERGHRGTRARGEQGNGGLDGWETVDLVRLRYGRAMVARR